MPSHVMHDAKATINSPQVIRILSDILKRERPKGWNTAKNKDPIIALINFSFIILLQNI